MPHAHARLDTKSFFFFFCNSKLIKYVKITSQPFFFWGGVCIIYALLSSPCPLLHSRRLLLLPRYQTWYQCYTATAPSSKPCALLAAISSLSRSCSSDVYLGIFSKLKHVAAVGRRSGPPARQQFKTKLLLVAIVAHQVGKACGWG